MASGRKMADIAAGKGRAPEAIHARGKVRGQGGCGVEFEPRRSGCAAEAAQEAALAGCPSSSSRSCAQLVDHPPAGEGWGHEIKLDGYRLQLRVADGEATLRTRKGLDWTAKFATTAQAAASLPDAIIDGEVVAVDDGRASRAFPRCRRRCPTVRRNSSSTTLSICCSQETKICASCRLRSARSACRCCCRRRPRNATEPSATRSISRQREKKYWQSACEMSLEGIISKRLDAPYVSGRTDAWTKSKCRAGQEVVIGGWSTTAGAFRSLLAGVHRNGRFEHVGRDRHGIRRREGQEASAQAQGGGKQGPALSRGRARHARRPAFIG